MTAPEAEHDRIFQRWQEQLAKIVEQLIRGFWHQVVWTEVRDEIQHRHPDADGTFLASYSSGYVAGQLLLVRRLADPNPDTDSLASLIQRIHRNPDVVTRSRYMKQCAAQTDDPWLLHRAEIAWAESFADRHDPERLDAALLQRDLDRLDTELEHIVRWATKTIAHLDPTRPERVPTYNEVREALDVLAKVTRRYQSLLNQSSSDDWTPMIPADWQAPFRPALFPIDFSAYYYPPPGGFT